jgi:hypothetical protein
MNGMHLILAHLVESDPAYREFYANLDDGKEKVMDNSAFEMFKLGREMYSADKLIEMGNAVGADVIVLPDFPMEPSYVTVRAAMDWVPVFKENGFKTFFVPQSEVGELGDYFECLTWAINNPDIDIIGLSILGCPIALGLEEQKYDTTGTVDSSYKMQRFLSRWKILNMMKDRNMFTPETLNRFHCLGMVDGPNEIDLLSEFSDRIRSWDTSSAPWLGLHGQKTYDDTPTGLRDGKYEEEVDFNFRTDSYEALMCAIYNMKFINDKEGITKT